MQPCPNSLCGCPISSICSQVTISYLFFSEETEQNSHIPNPIYENIAYIYIFIYKTFTKIFYFSFQFCLRFVYSINALYPRNYGTCGSHIHDWGMEFAHGTKCEGITMQPGCLEFAVYIKLTSDTQRFTYLGLQDLGYFFLHLSM